MFACVIRARCGVLFRKSRCAEYRYGASQDASSATPRMSFVSCNIAARIQPCTSVFSSTSAITFGLATASAPSLQGPANIQQVPIWHEYMYVFPSSSRSQFDEDTGISVRDLNCVLGGQLLHHLRHDRILKSVGLVTLLALHSSG